MTTSGTVEPRAQHERTDVSCLEQNGDLPESGSSEGEDTKESNHSGTDTSESSESSENESDGELENTSEDSSLPAEQARSMATGPTGISPETGFSGPTVCERCKNIHCLQSQKEKAAPRKIANGEFLLILNDEGIYECTETGLIFEVTKRVHIKYSVLSWSKFGRYVKKPWTVGGPIFDVKCDASILKSIQFPHSICLADQEHDVTFKVLHIHGSESEIEPSVDHSATHVKWRVNSLSPVGPLIQTSDSVHHHGVVIVYKVIDAHPSLSFRVYLAINNESFIKDIAKEVKASNKKFKKIDKPPVCLKLLQYGMKYKLISDPEAEINPEDFQFHDDSIAKLKSYYEVYFGEAVEFKLSLVEAESDEIVWTSKLRACDWVLTDHNSDVRNNNTNGNRRRKSSSVSDDETMKKRIKLNSDKVTDQQLMALARKFGKTWRESAILCLHVDMKDIEDIVAKEDDITMRKFRVLMKWRDKEQTNATVQNLHERLLTQDDIDYEVIKELEEMLPAKGFQGEGFPREGR
ncbi:NACHT, LRR and PYD domains-containing protein 1a allele 5-like [Ambystoma mexicanum]|uniref:NACHT, LRR and PYD domains-containing protein 1a allele 5-like n=1 Tax=Ambystoma mexicanum TaxID=8296 RepID=UPI0037E903D8